MDVSIIIPTYNRLWSLPRTIDSCKNNKCRFEIIIIDDGSTDGTWEWLQKQENIIALKQQNWGKCWAVNRGFRHATGKYIKFLDSDDMINAEAIDEQFILAEKENSDIVVSGYKLIDHKEQIIREQVWVQCEDFIAQQLGECDSSHYSSYLFKNEFIQDVPHRPDFAFRDDRLFVLELALQNPKISFHKGYGLLHRVHDNLRLQNTSDCNKNIQNIQHLNIYKKVISQLLISGELNQRRIQASVKILWPIAHWISKDNINKGSLVYQWIKELNPDFTIPTKGILGLFYRTLGFKTTEKILKVRRLLFNGIN